MAVLLAMYPHPEDAERFDRYYWDTHVPLARKMPGLKTFEVSKGTVQAGDGSSPYYLIARLTWDSPESMQDSLNSEEGKAAGADVANFAPEGTTVLLFDEERTL